MWIWSDRFNQCALLSSFIPVSIFIVENFHITQERFDFSHSELFWANRKNLVFFHFLTLSLRLHILLKLTLWNTRCCLPYKVNTLRPTQNGRHFADDTFKRIFLNENVRISIEIPPRFVPKGPINNIPALAQLMTWCHPGDKPLSEPMMVSLTTHICVTRPQWVNISQQPVTFSWGHFYEKCSRYQQLKCDQNYMPVFKIVTTLSHFSLQVNELNHQYFSIS